MFQLNLFASFFDLKVILFSTLKDSDMFFNQLYFHYAFLQLLICLNSSHHLSNALRFITHVR